MAAYRSNIWSAVLAVLLCLVVCSQQAPVDEYKRDKENFLDAFGEWLSRAEEIKNLHRRSQMQAAMKNDYPYYGQYDDANGDMGEDEGEDQGVAEEAPGSYFGEWRSIDDWPAEPLKLGQIGGVATDSNSNPVVFHRVDRVWKDDTFDENNKFTDAAGGAISEATVLSLNKTDGAIIDSWGKDLFYLPHGMTIDKEGNHWLTDVALHQVFKFGKDKTKPEMVLGKAFEPATGNDDKEKFCKPTDVAVASNGDFFVADGYCNSRIVKYSSSGEVKAIMGEGDFLIPHSLALVEDLDFICVADREHSRILCYKAGLDDDEQTGEPMRAFMDPEVMGRVFAITYSDKDRLMYAVTAPSTELPAAGLTIDVYSEDEAGQVVAAWIPDGKGFEMPHDVDVTPDGDTLYVGEIGPNTIWQFVKAE